MLLLVVGTPIAWWLTRTRSRLKGIVGAVVALPLVLPPTVIGFYLLVLMGPNGYVGKLTQSLGIGLLPFTFGGLVVGSVTYSLPFVVQPLQNAFEAMGRRPLEAAATLRAGPWDTFFTVALPLARPGIRPGIHYRDDSRLRAYGGRIRRRADDRREYSGRTRVVSVQIFDHVEALEYAQAHWLAGGMVIFSFVVLLLLYSSRRSVAAHV